MKRKAIAYLMGVVLLSLTVFGVLHWYNRIGETVITSAPESAVQEESATLESPPSEEYIPVSYTHLDVYKRQELGLQVDHSLRNVAKRRDRR